VAFVSQKKCGLRNLCAIFFFVYVSDGGGGLASFSGRGAVLIGFWRFALVHTVVVSIRLTVLGPVKDMVYHIQEEKSCNAGLK